jgi:peroxiredoxin Q/BCP
MSEIAVIALSVAALVAIAAFAVARRPGATLSNAAMPRIGGTAPGFTLRNEDDQPVSLDQHRGRWVVLYFYPKDRTTGCTIEAHNFQRDLPQYEALNAVVLGVSLDSAASHRNFCDKDSLQFTLLSDSGKDVARAYGSLLQFGKWGITKRNTFLIDPDGKIAQVWTKVNPLVHSKQVLAEIAERQQKRA